MSDDVPEPTSPLAPSADGAFEPRYERLTVITAVAGLFLAWVGELAVHGLSTQRWWSLGLRVVMAILSMPLLVACRTKVAPPWIDVSRLSFAGSFLLGTVALITVSPGGFTTQGWALVGTITLVGLLIRGPLRWKIALAVASVVSYSLWALVLFREQGSGYTTVDELVTVLTCATIGALAAPWVPHWMEQGRLREQSIRQQLEIEVERREEQTRRAELAAKEAIEAGLEAEREARLRTELLANISHDLRTPMAGVLGLVELMRDTELSEEQLEYVETIQASNQTLLSLLDDVVDLGRLEEGKLPIVPVSVPLAETLRRPAELLRVTADRKELELRVELDDGLPTHVELDPSRVQQILFNLLGNAIKFTSRGGVTLRACTRDWSGDRGLLRVEVEDTGIGFSPEQEEALFRRYTQAQDDTVHKFGGSGLGLSLCKGLVELMDGSIGGQSEPGRWALFWIEIPTREAQPPHEAPREAEPLALRVLLAEDNPVNQLVVSTMLKNLGQQVSVASDGEQALRAIEEEAFDLVIMDMQMPRLDGPEVTRRVRRLGTESKDVRIVALTASTSTEERELFREAGVDAVYAKPIDVERLRKLLVVEGAAARSHR